MTVLSLLAFITYGVAAAWSVGFIFRLREWRMVFLTIALVFMTVASLLRMMLGDAIEPTPDLIQIEMWVHLAISIIFLIGIVVTAREVLARKRAEEARVRENRRFREFFENSPVAMYRMAPDGTLIMANRALLRLLGAEQDEPEVVAQALADSDSWDSLEQRMGTGGEPDVLEGHLHRCDGRAIIVRMSAQPTFGRDGELRHYEGIVQDITEQREAEAALERSEQRYRLLAEHAWDMISLHDEEGRFLYVSPACRKLLGVGPEALLGRSVYDLVHADDAADFRRAHRQVLARDGDEPLVYRARRPAGGYGWFETTARMASPDEADGERRIIATTRDVTARKSLEMQFFESQKMESVGRLAGGVAHDFNNLLTGILGFAQLLEQGEPREEQKEGIHEIVRAAERARDLTRQLLAFGRRQHREAETLDPGEVVRDIIKLIERTIGADVAVRTAISRGAGAIHADRGQIQQVLMNLAVNARDAMPDGGSLEIRVRPVEIPEGGDAEYPKTPGGRYVCIEVEDEGGGIPDEIQEHVFEPFITTKEDDKGTGLGLATVYGIVAQNGGSVDFKTSGEGTTFRVLLPEVEGAPDTEGGTASDERRDIRRGRGRLLLVEDEATVRSLTRTVLERCGYEVYVAADADEAVAVTEEADNDIDLLLTDVVMPGRHGPELADELRTRVPGLRVVFMSGYTGDELRSRHALGEAFLIEKPFNISALADLVGDVLEGRGHDVRNTPQGVAQGGALDTVC